MSTTTISIEQLRADKWVAEVEVGGFVAKREHLIAVSRAEIMSLVNDACDRLEAQDPKRREAATPDLLQERPSMWDRLDVTYFEHAEGLDEPDACVEPEPTSAPRLYNLPKTTRGRPRKDA